MIRFLIDECLTPSLVDVANRSGFVAFHVQYRGWKSLTDAELLRRIRAESLTIVTNNWKDFRPMLRREEIHPGAVVLPNVPRSGQVAAFEVALRAIERRGLDLVNTVVEVEPDGGVGIYPLP